MERGASYAGWEFPPDPTSSRSLSFSLNTKKHVFTKDAEETFQQKNSFFHPDPDPEYCVTDRALRKAPSALATVVTQLSHKDGLGAKSQRATAERVFGPWWLSQEDTGYLSRVL